MTAAVDDSESTVHHVSQGGEVQADLHSVVTTLVVFGILTMSIYYFVLKPILSSGGPPDGTTHTTRQVTTSRHRQQQAPPPGAFHHNVGTMDSEVLAVLQKHSSCPLHVSSCSTNFSIGGSNILVDGLVPFRHGRAVSFEHKENLTQNRKERAKVLASVLEGVAFAPPSRGSTIVVSISSQQVNCPKQRRVLFLLATMYNLFVVLSFQDNVDDQVLEQTKKILRGSPPSELPAEVLPDHRMVAAQSVTGRVAFVRQLARVELVMDFDSEVKEQLSRFGFKVVVYGGKGVEKEGTESLLGKSLLP